MVFLPYLQWYLFCFCISSCDTRRRGLDIDNRRLMLVLLFGFFITELTFHLVTLQISVGVR